MLSYFMRTYCIREKYEKNPHNFNLYITTTSTLLSTEISTKNSIIQQFTIEYYYYYKKSFNKTLFSYKKGYRTQQKISSRTTTKSLYAKGSKIIKEDKLSESSISNLQKNTLNDTSEQELYRKYNMQEQQHNQQHPTTTTKTYSNQESNKIGAENSIEGKFEIFYYSNSKFNITTNLLQLLSTKQFILSENNNIKSIAEILTKNNIIIIVIIILHKVKIKKLIYLLELIVSCTVVQFRQNKSSKIFTMIPTLINLTEIVLVGVVETNSAIKELSNNEIGLTALNGTTTSTSTMKPSTTIMSTIIDNSYNKNNNFSYIETLRNNIIRNDYSAMSDEFNETFTPAMSQVILAPTVNSAIYFQTPCTVATVASGSTSNSFQIGANGTDDGINSFYFYETEQFALLWVLFTVIVLGNSAVLVTLFMNKNRKSRMNFFIKQLALADICVGLLNVLTDIIWRITVSWRAGNIACKIIRFSQVCVTYASTYVLVALSIDRYDAITHPMNFSGSWQRARRLVISAWTVSAIFSAPMLILYEEKLVQGQTQCWIELGASWRWQLYMSLVAITLFVFPALIISACYAIIVRTIWVKGSVFIPSERSSRNSACLASRRASSRGIIPRAKVKTVKMTFVIVIVFVVCWSPYIIFDLLQVFNQIPRTQTNIAIATFIQSLAPLNSAANPLIYCLFSTQVCRALKRIPPFRWILCSCCCQTQGHNSAPIRCTTVGQRLHNSCDSMRTLTTSLNVSRRSNNCMRPARVVIVERPKTILAMSEV